MEIRTYDQVDGHEVLRLNMIALDFPLTPKLVRALQENDRRSLALLYAVENGKVAGQVGSLSTRVETLEGPVDVGAVWAVATLPEFGRRGVARILMEHAEERLRARGCRAVTLGTSRTRVAHRLYRSMGYEDFLQIDSAYSYTPRFAPGSVAVRQVESETELPALEQTFFANTAGKLGFVHRQEDFWRASIRTGWNLREIHGVYRNGEPVGYVLAANSGEFLVVRSAVLPANVRLTEVLGALQELYPGPNLRVGQLTQPRHLLELEEAGCTVGPTWGTFMLKPLEPGLDFRRLMGVAEDRFYLDPLDIT